MLMKDRLARGRQTNNRQTNKEETKNDGCDRGQRQLFFQRENKAQWR